MALYFAYGSNMDEEQMQSRCPKFKLLGSARRKGMRLVFNKIGDDGTGKANLKDDDLHFVEGILYELCEEDLNKLDICESVKRGHYYKDNEFEVEHEGKRIKSSTYISKKTNDKLKPTRDYLVHLLNGKKYLTKEYFEMLSKTETLN